MRGTGSKAGVREAGEPVRKEKMHTREPSSTMAPPGHPKTMTPQEKWKGVSPRPKQFQDSGAESSGAAMKQESKRASWGEETIVQPKQSSS
ncbi:hypothetical protein NDU88_000335 [Pleurodeles waltl]|uniref:Uncharacterized protein n=1 Tax=Pleurodeles waltl TaxID=8319 RepID=A0AAV7VXT8_PLEWA|nr:hypothetical protein NDU88_000335 [Pleurodeles waltl]